MPRTLSPFRLFRAKPGPHGTTENSAVLQLQSQRDCGLQPRVARNELPWVGVRTVFNPNGVVSPGRHRAATPLGLFPATRFSQGSSSLATLGFVPESLWDSSLEIPQGITLTPSISYAARNAARAERRFPNRLSRAYSVGARKKRNRPGAMSAARQSRNRTARNVWSAWSLLPLSNHPLPCDSASKLDALQALRVAVHPQQLSQ